MQNITIYAAMFFSEYLKVQILFFRHFVLQEHDIVDREIKDISFFLYFPFV